MGVEIERKFLVVNDSWMRDVRASTRISQGYLANEQGVTVRVRIKGDQGYLTIKGRSEGISRAEFEYAIPVADAEQLLGLASGPVIDKVRHLVDVAGLTWEVDVFAGENAGLVLAEVELPSEDAQFVVPEWAGDDVSQDARYYNVNLASRPFTDWGTR